MEYIKEIHSYLVKKKIFKKLIVTCLKMKKILMAQTVLFYKKELHKTI
jgi:hypothetical protein